MWKIRHICHYFIMIYRKFLCYLTKRILWIISGKTTVMKSTDLHRFQNKRVWISAMNFHLFLPKIQSWFFMLLMQISVVFPQFLPSKTQNINSIGFISFSFSLSPELASFIYKNIHVCLKKDPLSRKAQGVS